jgi:Tol biopolymer transport system component
MSLNRIAFGGSLALILLAACAPQAGVVTEPALLGITEAATAASLEPSPTGTQEPYPAPIEPFPTQELEPSLTLEPYPPPAPTEPSVDPGTPGTVSGGICNPDAELPALTAYFEDVGSFRLTTQPIPSGQSSYQLDLPPGQYLAYAYLNGPNAPGGLYSEAVRCGLTPNCTDHNPAIFEVAAGQAVSGIDLCDWSAQDYIPPNPAPFDPRLAGMVYRLNEVNYFRYDEDGQAHPLFFTDSRLVLSPDGELGVFKDFEGNDLFTVEFSTGEISNLTDTPQVEENAYQWEAGLPERIVFTASAPGQPGVPWEGGLYAIGPDGSNRMVLDDEHDAVNFAISPDGQTIAYGWGQTAFLYDRESGMSEFNPRHYSPDLPDDLRIASPDWSPDGVRIAWHVVGSLSEQYQEGYGIFDLEQKTFQLIHPWAGDGRGPGAPWGASWSPDGRWLAITPFEPDLERRGVWLVDVDQPDKEIFMGASTVSPLWSPDGKWLAYHVDQDEKNTHPVWLYNPEAGEHLETALPPGAWAVDW